jgi:hypothetical protein
LTSEIALSLIYLAALVAVAATILILSLDAVVSVSRKPVWHAPATRLTLVETVDRRTQQLPFVGVDRRRSKSAADGASADAERRAG